MLARNYHSVPHNTPEEQRPHMTIWQCRPWFGSAWHGSEGSGLWLRMQTYDNLTYFSSKFKEKPRLVLE